MGSIPLKPVLLLLFALAQLPPPSSSQYDNSTTLNTSTMNGNTTTSPPIPSSCIGDGKISDWRATFTYYVWGLTWAIIGVLGNGICLLAAWRQAKQDHFYFLQSFIMLSDFFSCVFWLPCAPLVAEILQSNRGPNPAKQSLFLSWYMARLSLILPNIFTTTSLLLTVITVVDRMQALLFAVKYWTWNHKKRAAIIGTACFVIGVLTSLHDSVKRTLSYCPDTQHYQPIVTIQSSAAVAAEIIRILVRVASLLGMIILSPILAVLYHRQKKQSLAANAAAGSKSKENASLASNTLAKILFLQVFSIVLGTTPLLALYFITYLLPTGYLSTESSNQLSYVVNTFYIFMSGLNFVFFCGTSKSFRKALRDVVSRKTAVIPLSSSDATSKSKKVTTTKV